MAALCAHRQINPELREKSHAIDSDFSRFIIEHDVVVRGEEVGEIDAESTGEMIVANSRVLKLLGLTRQRSVSWPVFKGDSHDAVEHLGDLRRREAEIAVSAVPYRRKQPRLGQFRKMGAGRLRGDPRSIGQFGSRQRPAIQKR